MTARAAAVLALLCAAPGFALPVNTWVVSIGNNQGDARDVGLLYAEHDAAELSEALHLHARVPSEHLRVLLGDDADNVRQAIVRLNAEIRAVSGSEPSALFVFYSGHADATALHLAGTHLPFDELKALVTGSSAGVRVLIVDACRSGTLTRVKGVTPAPTFEIDLTADGTEGTAIVTSSAAGESSQESDSLGSSFFTHHLVNALRGAADANSDGTVTLNEAYAYTYAQTLRSSGETVSLQHPTYAYDVKGKGELVLSRPSETVGPQGRLRLPDASVFLVSKDAGGGQVVAEVAANGMKRELVLPARHYFVQQRGPNEYREYEVELEVGKTVDLQKVPFRSVRYDRLVRQRGGEQGYQPGVSLTVGPRGQLLPGAGIATSLQLGFGLDFAWGSLALRARGLTANSEVAPGLLSRRDVEAALGVLISRSVDLPVFTLGFGLWVEGVYFRQLFQTDRDAPPRSAVGASFAGVVSAELHLAGGFAARLEGGPVGAVFPRATVVAGTETGGVGTAFTWWASAGLVFRP